MAIELKAIGKGVIQKGVQLMMLATGIVLGCLAAFILVELTAVPIGNSGKEVINTANDSKRQWFEPVVQFHSLYTPAAGVSSSSDPDVIRRNLEKVSDSTRLRTALPDFSSVGYTISQVEALAFEGRPLVRFLYSKDGVVPLAFCVSGALRVRSSKLNITRAKGVVAANWTEGERSFLLVADEPVAAIMELQRIVRGAFSRT